MKEQIDKFQYDPNSVFPKSIQEWQFRNKNITESLNKKTTLCELNERFRKTSEEINKNEDI